jgi:hypothetical protein
VQFFLGMLVRAFRVYHLILGCRILGKHSHLTLLANISEFPSPGHSGLSPVLDRVAVASQSPSEFVRLLCGWALGQVCSLPEKPRL